MAYQPSWVIKCQSHLCRRTAVVRLNPLLEDISPKVNEIARLEFELVNYDVVVQHVNHYIIEIPTPLIKNWKAKLKKKC